MGQGYESQLMWFSYAFQRLKAVFVYTKILQRKDAIFLFLGRLANISYHNELNFNNFLCLKFWWFLSNKPLNNLKKN